jgi:hypothetical protein
VVGLLTILDESMLDALLMLKEGWTVLMCDILYFVPSEDYYVTFFISSRRWTNM